MQPGIFQWSTAANWSPNAAPTAADEARFQPEFGTTNAPGLVNSIIDQDFTVTNVFFNATNPFYHTLLISEGKTLSIYSPDWVTADKFTVRLSGAIVSNTAYVTVRGAGRVVVGDTNHPASNGETMRVHAIATNISATELGPHWATLDLSGLDYFAFALGSMKIGGVGASSGGAHGTLVLAKTNLVICGDSASTATEGWLIGNGTVTGAGNLDSAGDVQLGQENVFRFYNLRVGGSRSALGTMEFQPNLVNPTLRVRGVDGGELSPAHAITIGDNYHAPNTANYAGVSVGRLDLSGGTVDMLIEELVVGRSLTARPRLPGMWVEMGRWRGRRGRSRRKR